MELGLTTRRHSIILAPKTVEMFGKRLKLGLFLINNQIDFVVVPSCLPPHRCNCEANYFFNLNETRRLIYQA